MVFAMVRRSACIAAAVAAVGGGLGLGGCSTQHHTAAATPWATKFQGLGEQAAAPVAVDQVSVVARGFEEVKSLREPMGYRIVGASGFALQGYAVPGYPGEGLAQAAAANGAELVHWAKRPTDPFDTSAERGWLFAAAFFTAAPPELPPAAWHYE